MRKALVLVVLSLGPAVATALAQDEPAAFDADQARVYRAARGRALTPPSRGLPASVVARFLRGRGLSAATVGSLRAVGQDRDSRGITRLRLEQEVAGLRLAGAYVKAAVNGRGELVHLIEHVAAVTGRVDPSRLDERQALRAALRALYPALGEDPAAVSRHGNLTTFEKSAFFHAAPTVERVAVAWRSGALKTGFLVETWSERGNLLHDTLVGGEGRILDVELRTNTDSYNVFPDHPDRSAQTVVAGPGSGSPQSPAGWLSGGSQSSVNIAGNNVHAYLDTNADNLPDPGGTTITDGNFLTAADLTASPITAANRNVAVQNLFYLNNLIHDTLYEHGFTEAAGNFQEDNFGQGGRGSDSVNAEAQDGLGTDNANFATPRDGRNPRMQMFLWTGKGDHQVLVGPATYRAQGAAFGPGLSPTGVTDEVALADDGTGPSFTDACEAITSDVSGKIALIDRGNCNFTVKVKNAQNAGAVGAIVANNAGDSIITMGGADATITIPSVFIGQTDGGALKASLPTVGTIRRTFPLPLPRDGDVDSDIVWHEYGHGLTWRMIGRMRGKLAGAIGEGMSDTLSILVNDDDVVGEYSFADPAGIRSAAYTGYPRTYGDVAGTGVHFDGEVYAAIGWRLWEIFQREGIAKDTLLDYLVDGMSFTPPRPAFEHMRDGILQAVANAGSGHECLIWEAFAGYGVGVGAQGRVRFGRVTITESFTLPAECSAP